MKLFIDIETVRAYKNLDLAPDEFQAAWEYASKSRYPDQKPGDSFEEFGGLYPEFGKIVCITVKSEQAEKPTSFFGDDEAEILASFAMGVEKLAKRNAIVLVGHGIKYFDIPYINVRMAGHGMKILKPFKTNGLKPWELVHIDTVEAWKGGQFKTSQVSSLPAVCLTLGIPSPKDDISGAEVGSVYWSKQPGALERIKDYCEKDVDRLVECHDAMIYLNMI